MKITHCPPAYATGYAPSASDLEQLAEDTERVRDAFAAVWMMYKGYSGQIVNAKEIIIANKGRQYE